MKFSASEIFDVAYSTALPDDIKYELLGLFEEPVRENINEEVSTKLTPYVELLNTLTESSISKELFEEIITDVFSGLDEAFINEVSDEFVRQKAQGVLRQREKAYKEAKGNVIGLNSLEKANKAQARMERAKSLASKPSTTNTTSNTQKVKEPIGLSSLRNAAGKVKDWYDNNSKTTMSHDDMRKAIGRKAIENDKKGEDHFKNPTPLKSMKSKVNQEPEPKPVTPTAKTPVKAKKVVNQNPIKAKSKEAAQEVKPVESKPEVKTTKLKAQEPKKEATVKASKPKIEPKQTKDIGDEIHAFVKADKERADREEAQRKESDKKELEGRKKRSEKVLAKSPKKEPSVKVEKKVEETPKTENKPKLEAPQPKKEKINAEKDPEKIMNSVKPKERSEEQQDKLTNARVRREQQERMKALKNKIDGFSNEIKAAEGKPSYAARIPEIRQKMEAAQKEYDKLQTSEAISDLACLLLNTNISESSFVEIMELFAPTKENALKVQQKHDAEFKDAMDELGDEVGKHNVKQSTLKKVEKAGDRKEKFDNMFRKRFGNA